MKKINNKRTKIAVFYGGVISKHLVMVRQAAREMGVDLSLISYNQVCFDTESGKIKIRTKNFEDKETEGMDVNDFDVVFFRTTGKHWEEVDLVLEAIRKGAEKPGTRSARTPVVVDPMVVEGKPSYACKAWQMLKLSEAGIDVPKTIYGSLWYLYGVMENQTNLSRNNFSSLQDRDVFRLQKNVTSKDLQIHFPVILKGSGGDRGTRVFKADSLDELEVLVRDLRKTETEEGKRYMLQEFIENDGDYRVLVLGKKVLGVMKRSSQSKTEFKNNYSVGGKVEVADLPKEIKELAVKAAEVCGLWVAGVDVAFRNFDKSRPVIWEVNKGPQFRGFMQATGIDVPKEIVRFLVSLSNVEKNSP